MPSARVRRGQATVARARPVLAAADLVSVFGCPLLRDSLGRATDDILRANVMPFKPTGHIHGVTPLFQGLKEGVDN